MANKGGMGRKMNLDVLVKYLRKVDDKGYDSNLTCKVLQHLGCLDERTQRVVIKVALGVDASYEELMDHVRGLFKVYKQNDEEGQFCGLGFGNSGNCVSVATWEGWDIPEHADQVDITEQVCYKGADGQLRCGHLLDFAELWMDANEASFSEFLDGLIVD